MCKVLWLLENFQQLTSEHDWPEHSVVLLSDLSNPLGLCGFCTRQNKVVSRVQALLLFCSRHRVAHHYIPLNFSEGPRPLHVDCVTELLCFGSVWFTFTRKLTQDQSLIGSTYFIFILQPYMIDHNLCYASGPFLLEVCLAVLNQAPEGNAFHHLHICRPPILPTSFQNVCFGFHQFLAQACNWHYSPHSIIIDSFKGNTRYFNLSSHRWGWYQSVETELMTQDILTPQITETGKAEFYSTKCVHVFIPHPSNTGTTLITLLVSYTIKESVGM